MADSSNGSGTFVQPAIPKFDGFYEHWAKLMENFLRSKEFWSLVEDGIDEIPEETKSSEKISEDQLKKMKLVEEQRLKDMKVKNYLYQAIDREIMDTILNDRNIKANMGLDGTEIQGVVKSQKSTTSEFKDRI